MRTGIWLRGKWWLMQLFSMKPNISKADKSPKYPLGVCFIGPNGLPCTYMRRSGDYFIGGTVVDPASVGRDDRCKFLVWTD